MRKKYAALLVALALAVSLAGCAAPASPNGEDQSSRYNITPTEPAAPDMSAPIAGEADGANVVTEVEDVQSAQAPPMPTENAEVYGRFTESAFKKTELNPLSTFSIDVDTASYSNVRRYLNEGALPPADAVRIEEMINYFVYDYPQPKEDPVNILTQISECPWNTENKLAAVALQGKSAEMSSLPRSNLVFLVDVSGSMDEPDKLPLLVSSLNKLTGNLRDGDIVSLVTYSGWTDVLLSGERDKRKILSALDRLRPEGSTDGGSGIMLAYEQAEKHFIENGNNRVILCTDGDFNVGVTENSSLEEMIAKKRETGVYLSVIGFGSGNLKDDRMEMLADKGNGNYSYVDSESEGERVMVGQMSGTLFTIADDVKIQVVFDPETVTSYRLIGYDNRRLNDEDFTDDRKDAGEMGAGQSVTALYELVMNPEASDGAPPFVVKVRYKQPGQQESREISRACNLAQDSAYSGEFAFASAVAEAALLLRSSEYAGNASFERAISRANANTGGDPDGFRTEFVELMKRAQTLMRDPVRQAE